MHVYFDESNPSMEDIVVYDNDCDILEVLMEDAPKINNDDQLEHK